MIAPASSYAIFALSHLNGPKGGFKLVKEVAKEAEVPPMFLQKIINRLRQKGLVIARRGVGGGAKLARNLNEITLIEVLEIMEDPVLERKCVLGLLECNDQAPCPSHSFWASYRPLLLSHWGDITIEKVHESILSKKKRGTR